MGIVEGITEWLPISSTGHMILLEQIIKFNASEEFMSMFRVVIQLGAIKAHKTSLVLVPGKENTPFAPNEVQPVETEVGLDLNQPFELEAASMVVE